MAEIVDPNATYQFGPRSISGRDYLAGVVALKRSYVMLQKRYRPDIKHAGGDESRWQAAAKMLLANSCDPYGYMAYAFEIFIQKGTVVPNMVTSLKIVERYVLEKPDLDAELELLIQLQANLVQTYLRNGVSLPEILGNTKLEMSAVFRYALAYSEKLYDLAVRFEEDAKRMLVFKPAYRHILAKWLPAEEQR